MKTKKIKVFSFKNENKNHIYILPIYNVPKELFEKVDELEGLDYTDDFQMCLFVLCNKNNMESRFGVHDTDFGGKYIDGDIQYHSYCGYTSYEVEDWNGLKTEWSKILKENGVEIGRWKTLKETKHKFFK